METPPGRSPGVRWNWIASPRADLVWFVGSALAGWLYIALVLWLGRGLPDPIRDPFHVLHLGDLELPLSLGLVVYGTWAVLLDAPHLFATLARTFLDPDEWDVRRRVLLSSLGLFVIGPALLVLPFLATRALDLPAATAAVVGGVAFVLFRLWAYYHVVRQHWGFLVLYKRKNDDAGDPLEDRADTWFFNCALWLPLVFFLTAPWYADTRLPPTGLLTPLGGTVSPAAILHPLTAVAYGASLLGYGVFQVVRFRRGVPRNGPKLLLLASVVPLHLAAFASPLLVLFVVPVVTVGHNLQYHRIVWMYGRNKYAATDGPRYRFVRPLFRHVALYAALGLAFTLLLYRGPLVSRMSRTAATFVERAIDGAALLLGGSAAQGPSRLGGNVVAAFLLGWAMQHYYLDARIWRVSRDRAVAKSLGVA